MDVTAPAGSRPLGRLHPITLLMEEVIDHFTGLGFEVATGPEIEDEFHNFDALNIPKDHPARDVWDTFYTDRREIPRTHTSSVQVRTMLSRRPPFRIVAPGRCFRRDAVDATHSANFHQVEGLWIDRQDFLDLVSDRPELLRGVFAAVSRNLRRVLETAAAGKLGPAAG